jgi:TATA-binding protein-associated factor
MAIEESARSAPDGNKVGIMLRTAINTLIDTNTATDAIFLDLIPFLQTLRRQCQALENVFVDHGKLASSKVPVLAVLVEGEPDAGPHAFAFATAVAFMEKDFERLNNQLTSINRARASKLLKESRDSLQDSIDEFKGRREVHERRIVSAATSAILWLGDLGSKLNPIIQGIMNAVKVTTPQPGTGWI